MSMCGRERAVSSCSLLPCSLGGMWKSPSGSTACDFALVIKMLVDLYFPEAEKIVVVLDNLNTHTAASLYQAFDPAEAKRLADKIEWHYTPRHGSWLDMAEIELSVLARQCLDRHLPTCRSNSKPK